MGLGMIMNYKKKLIFLSVLVPLLVPHCGYANEGMMEDMLIMKDMQGIATPVAIQNGIKTVVVIGAAGYAGAVAWRYRRNILKDLTVLKKDTAAIKEDTSIIKQDTAAIKETVTDIKRTQGTHTTLLNSHSDSLAQVLKNQRTATDTLSRIENDVKNLENGVSTHNGVVDKRLTTIESDIAILRQRQDEDSKTLKIILGQVVSHRAETGKGLLELLKDKVSNIS